LQKIDTYFMSKNCYTSLEELPMWNWWQWKKEKDISYFKIDPNQPTTEDLLALVVKLEQEYLDTFGADDQTDKLMELLKRKVLHQCAFLQGKKYVINYIKAIDFQIEMMGKSQDGVKAQSLAEISSILSKYMGYRVDPKIESVVEFMAKLEMLENENKKLEKHGSKTNTK